MPEPVRAAGTALWRPGPDGPLVAVVHRPRYDDWSLPKGKLEPGEHPAAAAARETLEETGHTARLGRGLGSSAYDVLVDGVPTPKTVRWWAAEATGGAFVPGPEVDALRWLPVASARALLTAGRDTAVLDGLVGAPAGAAVLLLVRHGRAGRRGSWTARTTRARWTPPGRLRPTRWPTCWPCGARRSWCPRRRCAAPRPWHRSRRGSG